MIIKNNSIVLISNIIFEPYLRTHMAKIHLPSTVQLKYVAYEEIYEKHIQNSDIIVICLNFDALYPNAIIDVASREIAHKEVKQDAVRRCQELYYLVKTCSNVPIIWFGFEDYYINSNIVSGNLPVLDGLVDKVNQAVRDMLTDDVFVDLKRLIAMIGLSNSYSMKAK